MSETPDPPTHYRTAKIGRLIFLGCALGIGWAGGFAAAKWSTPSRDRLLNAARKQIEAGEFAHAVTLLQRIPSDPADVESQYWLGQALLQTQRPAEAAAALSRIPIDHPLGIDARGEAGIAWLTAGYLDRAEEALREFVVKRPEPSTQREELRWLYFNTLRPRAGRQLLLAAVPVERDNLGLLIDLLLMEFRRQLPRDGLPYLLQVQQRVPNQFTVLVALADCEWQTGNREAAQQHLKLALDLRPTEPAALLMLAEWALETGQTGLAEQTLKSLDALTAEQSAGDERLALLHGQVELRLGHDDRAVDRLRKAIEQAPGEAAPVQLLGQAYRHLGQIDKANEQFQRAKELDDTRIELANIVYQGQLEQPTAAIAREVARLCAIRNRTVEAEQWQRWASQLPPAK